MKQTKTIRVAPTQMNLYALKLKTSEELLKFSVSSNGDDAEFCNSTTVYLEPDGESVWIATSQEAAEKAMVVIDWYNSSIDQPCHKFKPEDLEVVQFQII